MKLRMPVRPALLPILLLACAVSGPLQAQQLIGYVSTRDADVTGATDVVDGRAVLTGSVSVTAKDHTAPISLGRGGTVRVCQTSVVHLTESRAVAVAAPLLFSLDRGAIEIQMKGTPNDSIMTPDLRFTVRNDGPLDLRLRIARNGDTCVENRGPLAPTLAASDPFGEAMYELQPGQHVLFEHGSLHEVVDHESSPCGCPDEKGMSIADALLAAGPGASAPAKVPAPPPAIQAPAPAPAVPASTPADVQAAEQAAARAAIQAAERNASNSAVQAAEQHPFPAAVSEGLAPAPEVPQAPPGEVHTQISDSLSYNAPASGDQAGANSSANAAAPAPAQPSAAPKPAPRHDLVHIVGRFFRRLFGG
jgi:hypothetical protein